jgi:hypothetical protein
VINDAVGFMAMAFGWPSVLLIAASPSSTAVASDMLPLTRGIYVRAGVPCRGASNADTMSYWGHDNGINIQRLSCRIARMRRDDSDYVLDRRCRDIRTGGPWENRITITIVDRMAFLLQGNGSIARTRFRYCGPRAQAGIRSNSAWG